MKNFLRILMLVVIIAILVVVGKFLADGEANVELGEDVLSGEISGDIESEANENNEEIVFDDLLASGDEVISGDEIAVSGDVVEEEVATSGEIAVSGEVTDAE